MANIRDAMDDLAEDIADFIEDTAYCCPRITGRIVGPAPLVPSRGGDTWACAA